MGKLHISHYSDVLCVWAYVSQIRINELIDNFGDKVELEYLLFPVFGNAIDKIDQSWEGKGGRKAFGEHVKGVVDQFGHLPVHEEIWLKDAPVSSLPSHLYLCAAQFGEQNGTLAEDSFAVLAWQIRTAFFAEARDISSVAVIHEIIEEQQMPLKEFESAITSGRAYAVLSGHMKRAMDNVIKASPTMTFNEDRQRLTGNVGYRIIEANVRELLERPETQQTWC